MTETSTTTCRTCQVHESVMDGTATDADSAHWSMWGCTCTAEATAEAVAWMDQVTR